MWLMSETLSVHSLMKTVQGCKWEITNVVDVRETFSTFLDENCARM